jgi:hypothetical protein
MATYLAEVRKQTIGVDVRVEVLWEFSMVVVVCTQLRTLQNRLQGSMRPLWLVDPGPESGASCTCWPGPWTKLATGWTGDLYGLPRGGEYCGNEPAIQIIIN